MSNKKILVCGASGFIGTNLIMRHLQTDAEITGVDLCDLKYLSEDQFHFIQADLRDYSFCDELLQNGDFDEIYQLAADMGGAGYIFTGDSDADIITNSAMINLNILRSASTLNKKPKIFYSSSACIYPKSNQNDPKNPYCEESSAYPADPDSEYGWEKLFSERLYLSYARNYGIDVKIARFHNVYGPFGVWDGGKEKAPAAICRKVAIAEKNGEIEIWGDGLQTRTFLYIDDCLDAMERFMNSDNHGPLNVGSEEMVSINELARIAMKIADKELKFIHVEGPMGVRGRCSHNLKIQQTLNWSPQHSLARGIEKTYHWIAGELKKMTENE